MELSFVPVLTLTPKTMRVNIELKDACDFLNTKKLIILNSIYLLQISKNIK
jgi:hypothetical protein